jgi:hypothetical protein
LKGVHSGGVVDLSLLSSAQEIALKISETMDMSELFEMSKIGQGAKMIALIAEMQKNDKKMMEKATKIAKTRCRNWHGNSRRKRCCQNQRICQGKQSRFDYSRTQNSQHVG